MSLPKSNIPFVANAGKLLTIMDLSSDWNVEVGAKSPLKGGRLVVVWVRAVNPCLTPLSAADNPQIERLRPVAMPRGCNLAVNQGIVYVRA
jgi:hypothetical protein